MTRILTPLSKLIKKINPSKSNNKLPVDMENEFINIHKQCKSFTMTSEERMYAMYKATEYVSKNNIAGDIVECGTWKGGSAMISAIKLKKNGDMKRKFYLYDTYEGMTYPTDKDISYSGGTAKEKWKTYNKGDKNLWCCASLKEVKGNMLSAGYPENQMVFIKGKVEETIPNTLPKSISILRLDTDWYESTYHELVHLFPLLSKGGVLIIDDYGHWKGAREATDKYFEENNIPMLLSRIDYTGRIGIKI